jgi:hypothetical protein
MLTFKRWTHYRLGVAVFPWPPFRDTAGLIYHARFEGWFLFGLLPLWVRQVSDWE